MPPTRQNVRKWDSPDVQGEDSWVIIRKMEAHEYRSAMSRITRAERLKDRDATAYQQFVDDTGATPGEIESQSVLAQAIVKWNWVDTDGTPLPQPKEDPGVIARLTGDELSFLNRCLYGPTDADIKNSSSN